MGVRWEFYESGIDTCIFGALLFLNGSIFKTGESLLVNNRSPTSGTLIVTFLLKHYLKGNAKFMTTTLKVNGITVEYSLTKNGSPVIIFFNGFRMPLSSWNAVSVPLARFGTVLQFNRFGVGKTSSVSFPHTGIKSIELLQEVLEALDLKPPYILVAHSLGGLLANLYARLHHETVAGVVFVDATHPDEKAAQSKFQPPMLLKLVSEGIKSIEKLFDKHKYSEDETYDETLAEIRKHPSFPTVPLTVISGIKKLPFVPEDSFFSHLEYQEKLLDLSPISQHILAEDSGHFPQITEPNVVIEAIKEMLESVKNSLTVRRVPQGSTDS